MAEEQRTPPKDISEAKTYIKRDLGTWLNMIESAQQRIRNLAKDAEKRQANLEERPGMYEGDEELSQEDIIRIVTDNTLSACEEAITNLQNIQQEMSVAESDLANLSDVLEVMKADADYKAVVVNTWPKNVFADRMTYLGAALLGAGSGTYAFLGLPLELGAPLIPALVLWGVGFFLLVAGLVGVRKRERLKWEFFSEEFEIFK